ncbi:ML2 [Symbiodinium necroappetens]|uniref:ML2 protein n=1 Tax=Symbiodinium necroappetens TaxID=1628268 RepID=A0A813A7A2_9DINO|nr:ML2 [Symbiodinium necroappetens]
MRSSQKIAPLQRLGQGAGKGQSEVLRCPLAELDTAVFGSTQRNNMSELREKEKAKKPRRRGGASANVEKGIFKPYHSVSVPKHADLLHHFQADRPKTTVMLRNIPNRYSQASLLQEIDLAGYRGTYDFFYLPMDTQNRTNVGYAFINFLTSPDLERFMVEFAGYLFQNHSSQKVARVSLAHIQGFIENIRHCSNRAVSQSRNSQYRPIVIHQGVRMDISEAYDLLCSVQAGQSSQDDSAKVPLPPGSLAVAEPPGLSENLPSILPHLASGPSTSEDYAERYSEAKKGFEEAVSMLLRSSCSGREAEALERPELEDDERTEGSHSQPGSPRRIFQGVPGAKNIPVPFFLESPQGGAEASDLATPRTNRTLFVHGRFSA